MRETETVSSKTCGVNVDVVLSIATKYCLAALTYLVIQVIGKLVADPNMSKWHVVEVDVWGVGDIGAGTAFHVHTERRNPTNLGAVTGSATYMSFFSSLKIAQGRGPGIHLC